MREAPQALRADLISTDDYFLPDDKIPRFHSPTSGRETPDYNRPDSIDAGSLRRDIRALSSKDGRADVLLVEGLMVLHLPEIRELFDLRLFLELEGEYRALRRLVRNLGEVYDPISDHSARSIANYYLESALVGHRKYVEPSRVHADLILRGDGDFTRTAPMVAAIVRERLGSLPAAEDAQQQ